MAVRSNRERERAVGRKRVASGRKELLAGKELEASKDELQSLNDVNGELEAAIRRLWPSRRQAQPERPSRAAAG